MMSDITIVPIPILKDNYVWMGIQGKHVYLIDPGESSPIISYLKDHHLTLTAIFLTHHHWDHTNGVVKLLAQFPVPVYGSILNSNELITHPIDDNDIVHFHEKFADFKVLSIPGHTLDHVAFLSEDILFCGDTLFAAGCGRMFEGTPDMLYASLQKLAALPTTTRIYCAHEYTLNNLSFAKAVEPNNVDIDKRIEHTQHLRDQQLPSLPSCIEDEKRTNPFLRCHIKAVINSAEQFAGQVLENAVQVFKTLREWKNTF